MITTQKDMCKQEALESSITYHTDNIMQIKSTLAGIKKVQGQSEAAVWIAIYVATRIDMKLRPRNLVRNSMKFCFKILVC